MSLSGFWNRKWDWEDTGPLEEKPFSEFRKDIQQTKTFGQDQWAIVQLQKDSDFGPTLYAWKLEQERAFLWDSYVSDITLHGDLYWLHRSLFSGGKALWKRDWKNWKCNNHQVGGLRFSQ